MMTRIILAHARDTKALAAKTGRRLMKLGFEVDPVAIDKVREAASAADRVIVLWSLGAARAAPTLKHPDLAEKLRIVRLASGPPPPLRAPIISLPSARRSNQRWRAFVDAETKPRGPARPMTKVSGKGSSRWGAVLTVLLMTIVVGGASYVASPDFANVVDATVASFEVGWWRGRFAPPV